MSQAQTAAKDPAARSWNAFQTETDAMDTQELLDAYRTTGDENYKWALVLRYRNSIEKVALQAKGIYSHFVQVDDVISEGVLTLLSAIDKYDPEKGARFDTYVSRRIRGMIIDMARKQDWLPRSLRKRTKEINVAVTELYNELNRYPNETEIAEKLGITPEKYQKEAAAIALGNVLSLDAMLDMSREDSGALEIPTKDATGQPEAALQELEFRQILADGIRRLKKNEQIVLSLYYEKDLHMKEIAQVMEISAPRVSQIHAGAIEKLQDYMRAYLHETDSALRDKKRKKE
ncbi:MAG: FliA/WhiG family RNA polymerase sigma factor [Clostridiales bacterium]|nr:FliA/WhiG family RNA polymerase sigma factor [Clostridiales bacterium]